MRWRCTRATPSKAAASITTLKWLSPPSRAPAWPAWRADSSSIVSEMGEKAALSLALRLSATAPIFRLRIRRLSILDRQKLRLILHPDAHCLSIPTEVRRHPGPAAAARRGFGCRRHGPEARRAPVRPPRLQGG